MNMNVIAEVKVKQSAAKIEYFDCDDKPGIESVIYESRLKDTSHATSSIFTYLGFYYKRLRLNNLIRCVYLMLHI